jgi:high-affinity iron transporter
MRWLVVVLLLCGASARADDVRWHRAVGLLEYLEGDYGNAVASGDADELAEQRGLAEELVKQLEGSPYLERAKAIQSGIVAAKPGAEVTPSCGALAKSIVTEQALVRSPKQTPSLEVGAKQFETNCASCHGLTGGADTPMAKQLDPPPANFLDDARMRTLTPYKAFNTSTFGIQGTAMAGFSQLPEDVRWAQAFHLFTLRQPKCDHPPVAVALSELATSTDVRLAEKYGANEVACLRRVLPKQKVDSLSLAQAGLDDALTRYAQGDIDGARQAVVDAYLNGLEPVEPMLRARDPQLVGRLENAFTRSRLAAQTGQYFEAEVLQTKVLIGTAQEGTSTSSFWSVFFAALFILLREGFEAVVVVGALLAVLKKMNAPQYVRVVHVAWVSALVFGAAAFVLGQAFFAGANREWLETIVALVAVGFLLYAALWLNARANVSRSMGELRGKMTAAIGTGSAAGLFFISFSSVGRESIEAALFLQGLAVDSHDGVIWGATAGLIALLALVVTVRTVGFKLPMKTLFTASTVLLFVTAVMLLGKGLHGLQELGVLPLHPVPFFQIDALGIFPDAWSLVPQVLLSFAPVLWKLRDVTTRPAPTTR